MSAVANYPVVGRPHPFSEDVVYCEIAAGQTLAQALGDNIKDAVKVEIGGREVPRKLWPHVKPKAGVPVYITAYPQGDSGKKILRAVLMIVVAVIAWYAAPALAGAMGFTAGTTAYAVAVAGISAAITMVGGMLVNALVPPPMPAMAKDAGGDPTDRLNSLTGTSNRANHGGAIPCVIGECKFFPTHAALPYTEIIANEQYLYMLLDLGKGDLVVSDTMIGETAIDEFDDEVQYRVTKTPQYFTNDIFELSVGVVLEDQGESAIRTTQAGTEEITIDIVFPQGLYGVNNQNATIAVTTNFDIRYRPVGSTAWTTVQSRLVSTPSEVRYHSARFLGVSVPFQVKSGTRDPIRMGFAWKVPYGQYEVEVIRGSTNWGASEENARIGTATWTVLRSLKKTNPSKTGTTKLEIRLRATERLNGAVDNVSVIAAQKIPVWDPISETWTAPQTNLNPAYVYRWLLKSCPAVKKHVSAHRIDDEMIIEFGQQCIDKGFKIRGMADYVGTLQEMLQAVLAAGRATLGWRNNKYSVVWDRPQTVARQHFTPLNSSGFQSVTMYTDQPHAFRVKFTNIDHDWQEDEIIVPFDGYAHDDGTGPKDAHGDPAPGLPLATKFETLQFRFVTEPLHAWKLARYHQGQGVHRATNYSFKTDIEHLAVNRGDMVYAANDVMDWGMASARVKKITLSGSNVTQLELDQDITFGSDDYSIRIRKNDNTTGLVRVNPVGPATTAIVALLGPMQGVNVGDLVIVGVTNNESKRLLITGIKPEGGLNASMTAVEYKPEVYNMDLDPPSQFISAITGRPITEPPPEPKLEVVYSTNTTLPPGDDDGGGRPGIGVVINPGPPRRGGFNGGLRRNNDTFRTHLQ